MLIIKLGKPWILGDHCKAKYIAIVSSYFCLGSFENTPAKHFFSFFKRFWRHEPVGKVNKYCHRSMLTCTGSKQQVINTRREDKLSFVLSFWSIWKTYWSLKFVVLCVYVLTWNQHARNTKVPLCQTPTNVQTNNVVKGHCLKSCIYAV